jgi:hypothetical protein
MFRAVQGGNAQILAAFGNLLLSISVAWRRIIPSSPPARTVQISFEYSAGIAHCAQ